MLTKRKVASSIPDEVTDFFFFNLPNTSNRSMAVELTQSLTEICTRNVPADKVVRVPGYRSRGPGSIPSATRFSEV
jgi:hypothetical protein